METVAPHAGAWIETPSSLGSHQKANGSHPTRVRGLKQHRELTIFDRIQVAPHAGAWIETKKSKDEDEEDDGRTPRGCVD